MAVIYQATNRAFKRYFSESMVFELKKMLIRSSDLIAIEAKKKVRKSKKTII